MQSVAFFIDGFNLYHSLKESAPDCRWLNLRKLCNRFISPNETISAIYYFSALATWKGKDTVDKHKKYIQRLKDEQVIVVLGKFKEKDKCCRFCQAKYKAHEEKQTDVNIVLKIVSEAILDHYDTAILVSGDTDMIPAITTVRELSLGKRIGVLFPVKRKTMELASVADFSRKITIKDLRDCLFEAETAPEGWHLNNPAHLQ